jgi:hypothetical protein
VATEDEVRRLILEVVGEDRIRQLREQVDKEREALLALTSTMSNLTPAQIAQDKAVQAATVHMAELNQEIVKLGGSHRNLGYAALEASRAFEDLQYGIGGVINNIPGLVMALGGGAGLTAALSVLAVVGNQLVKHFFPDWEGGVKKVKEANEQLTEAIKEQQKALKALEEAKPAKEGVEGVIGEHREEMRKALADQIRAEAEADIAALPRAQRRFGPPVIEATPQTQARLAFAQRRIAGAQLRADEILGRAVQGGLPEQFRLRQLFGPETEIGAGLAEADPGRIQQREQEERDVERQRRMHRLDEQIARQKEQQAQKSGQLMGQAFQEEEQDLQRQHQDDQHAAQEKKRAAEHEIQAAKRAAAAKEREAARAEREGIENVRYQVEQAIGAGAPAGIVAQQANAMLNKIAMTSGRTTNLVQAQGRLMLHLQQVAERQERQLEAAERDLQRGWDNAFRRGK